MKVLKDVFWIARGRVRGVELALMARVFSRLARLVAWFVKWSAAAPCRQPWQNTRSRAIIQAVFSADLERSAGRLAQRVRWALAATMFVATLPLTSLLRELAVVFAANLLNWASSSPFLEWPVTALVADPIYARVALEMLSNIHARGLAVSGLIGFSLHNLWPSLFLAPELVAERATVSAVMASGSSVISRFMVAVFADGLLITLGVLLAGWRLKTESLRHAVISLAEINGRALFGLLLQIRGALAIMSIELTQADLEHSGLAHIGTKLFVTSRQTYETSLPVLSNWLSLGLRILAIVIIYIAALLFARLVFSLIKTKHPGPLHSRPDERSRLAVGPSFLYLSFLAAVVVFAFPSSGMEATNFAYDDSATSGSRSIGRNETALVVQSEVESPSEERPDSLVKESLIPTLTLAPAADRSLPSSSSVVSVRRGPKGYVYLVNGKRAAIRGVGYNVIYRNLADERRARRYERDFARMAGARINTILGWDADQGYTHDKFDDLLLAKASKHGLGVLMPYFLDPDGDYSNEEYRSRLVNDVLAWVRRFKDRPAVRMWAIGNEVMHGMEAMEVLRGTSPKSNPSDFVSFYLKLVDAVHKEDPNHPVIYREAEDGFFDPFKAARPAGVEVRPWLVFGMNIFSSRLSSILTEWDRPGFDNPLLISEFGPTGLSPQDRPLGLVRMWKTIRRHPCSVLGGIVYAWTTVGPEPMDRVFGLVDGDGNAIDGSLDAIGHEFRQDSSLQSNCRP